MRKGRVSQGVCDNSEGAQSIRIKLDRSGKTLLSHQLTERLKAAIRRGESFPQDLRLGSRWGKGETF